MTPTEQRRTRTPSRLRDLILIPTVEPLRGSVGPKFRACLAGLLCVRGSAAPSRTLLAAPLITLCALFASLALSAGLAQASFVRNGGFGSSGSGEGQFGSFAPSGVAVDPTTGDVYLSDLLAGRVERFDSKGTYISQFGSPGSGGGQMSAPSGLAVDPSTDDLYVAEYSNLRVQELSSSGAFILMFGGQVDKTKLEAVEVKEAKGETPSQAEVEAENLCTAASGDTCGAGVSGSGNSQFSGGTVEFLGNLVAVDPAGDVYVADPFDVRVEKFDSQGKYLSQITSHVSHPVGVAVDPSGNLYVADPVLSGHLGVGAVKKFDASGAFLAEIGSGTNPQAVATDSAGNVFAFDSAPEAEVVEYSPAGAQIETIGAGSLAFGAGFVHPAIALGGTAKSLYVTQPENSEAQIFLSPTAPTLGKERAADVGTTEAKLGALVSPGGLEASYYFEYDTREYKEGEKAHGQTAPIPAQGTGSGVQPRTVWATVQGLQPGTTYHYRAVATNELGSAVGVDQTFTTQTPAQASCPNEQLRTGFSANLPDCRAYELVTPPNNVSAQPDPYFGNVFEGNLASSDGNRFSYFAVDVLPGSRSAARDYLATRGQGGWTSENLAPPQSGYYGFECERFIESGAYSADMSMAVLLEGGNQNAGGDQFGGGCGGPDPELVSGEPRGVQNLFLRDNTTHTYQLIDVTPPGVAPAYANLETGSSDLSVVLFRERAQLVPGAPGGFEDLYAWSAGVVHLVTVLPDGTPTVGSLAAPGEGETHTHVISADGSRVFFKAGGNLYVRENTSQEQSQVGGRCVEPAKACTVQVDALQTGGGGGGGKFVEASADGSRVLFTAEAKLTADSTAESGEPDLYECELPQEAGGPCKLTDLTVAKAGEHANVLGVFGASADGSYVYFVAEGALPGSQANEHGETAQGGQANLYLSHGGTTRFIATLLPGGEHDCFTESCSRVSPSGAFLAFDTRKSLTGYDNTDSKSGEKDLEIFLYDAAANSLLCASCNPSGEPPTGGKPPVSEGNEYVGGGANMEARDSATGAGPGGIRPGGAPHYLAESGRLFFDTTDALLPQDTNSKPDVYEFEPDGVGSCADVGGCVFLISTGTSSRETGFIDASPSGNDVFLRQYQKLVPRDTQEEARTLYDARVGGGFPEPSAPPPCTTADACRSAPAPEPLFPSAGVGTAAVFGEDNLSAPTPPVLKTAVKSKQCKKGFVKKKNRCVKKPKPKKAKKSARANGRAH